MYRRESEIADQLGRSEGKYGTKIIGRIGAVALNLREPGVKIINEMHHFLLIVANDNPAVISRLKWGALARK